MNFTDKKLEIAIFGFAVVMVTGMGYLLKAPVESALAGGDIVYEMPRPKGSLLASLFNLGDREIDRKYVNPFAKKKADEKKVADIKKAATAAAAAKPVAKTAAKTADEKKPQVDVQVVGSDESKKWGDDGFMAKSSGFVGGYVGGGAAGTGAATSDKNTNDKEKTKSAEEWRALLASEPTTENMTKLLSAYSKGQLSSDGFFAIVNDLFASNKLESQKLAMMAVESVYHANSFVMVSHHYESLPQDMKIQADNYQMSYAAEARLPILASILKGTDVAAISDATQVVIAGYEAAKTETPVTSTSPRAGRGTVTANSLTGYTQFISIYEELTFSKDATIASLAHNALSTIQTSVATVSAVSDL